MGSNELEQVSLVSSQRLQVPFHRENSIITGSSQLGYIVPSVLVQVTA